MAKGSKVRSELAQMFVDSLSKGQLPWRACWQQVRPMNGATGTLYHGVNAMNLSWWAQERGYSDPRWCTYLQAQERGWQVQKGAKAVSVEYWAYYDTKQKKLLKWSEAKRLVTADPKYMDNLRLSCKTFSVFNAEQIDGIPALQQRYTNIDVIREQRDTLLRNMGVGYREEGNEAYYSPKEDRVTLPPEHSFDDVYSYMATLLHECGHATGHSSRLDRDLSGRFGSESYAREELRAEIASAFTGQTLGLQMSDSQLQYHLDQHAAYVQHWAEVLQKSPDELFRAIKAAEEISDYLIEKGEFDFERLQSEVVRVDGISYSLTAMPDHRGLQLQIDGQGDVSGFEKLEDRPFQEQAASIREVVIGEGITSLGKNTLNDLPRLESISYPSTSKKVASMNNCPRLKGIEFRGAERRNWNTRYGMTPSELLRLAQEYPGMNHEQLGEIAAGLHEGLTSEQVAVYAKPELSSLQMHTVHYALSEGLTLEQATFLADARFGALQMDVIRCGFTSGFSMEQVCSYAKPEIPAREMLDHYWDIREQIDKTPTRIYGYTMREWNSFTEDQQIAIQDKHEYDLQHSDQGDWDVYEPY